MRKLLMSSLVATCITLMTGQPANAAFLFICDWEGCGTPDPNVTFSITDF